MPNSSIDGFSVLSPSQKKELERQRQEEEARKAAKKAEAERRSREAARKAEEEAAKRRAEAERKAEAAKKAREAKEAKKNFLKFWLVVLWLLLIAAIIAIIVIIVSMFCEDVAMGIVGGILVFGIGSLVIIAPIGGGIEYLNDKINSIK